MPLRSGERQSRLPLSPWARMAASRVPVRSDARPAILSIDDDSSTCEIVNWALSLVGLDVETANSGAEGLAAARLAHFDLMLVDQLLPDMRGTDVVRTLRNESRASPFVLVSGFLTTAITVEAMKLGAVGVMEKPVEIDELVPAVYEALHDSRVGEHLTDSAQGTMAWETLRPGSVAERWALHVLKGCESTKDLRTIEDWAFFIGVSYSSLRESCHLLGIQAHDARDLMRMLRVVLRCGTHRCSPEVMLDVSDGRTLDKLMRRAGFDRANAGSFTPEQFLLHQHFVSQEHAALRILSLLVADHTRAHACRLREPIV